MPSRDGGRQSQIRSYVTRGLQIPVNPKLPYERPDDARLQRPVNT